LSRSQYIAALKLQKGRVSKAWSAHSTDTGQVDGFDFMFEHGSRFVVAVDCADIQDAPERLLITLPEA